MTEPTAATVKSFRDLRVWQAAMTLIEQIYRLTGQWPRDELYGLTAQVRRAAVSVPSNIAEGHTREHTKEYLNHLSMAQASLAEVETQLDIAGRLDYLTKDELADTLAEAAALGRSLYALRNALLGRTPNRLSLTPDPRPLTPDPPGGA